MESTVASVIVISDESFDGENLEVEYTVASDIFTPEVTSSSTVEEAEDAEVIATPKIEAARKFDDIYVITNETLGCGKGGAVKSVLHKFTNNQYALKKTEVTDKYSQESACIESFILHLGRGHENIVQLIDYFIEDGNTFSIMEKLMPLSMVYDFRERFDERESAKIVKDVANALKHLHEMNMIHRDVKIENILCSENDLFPIKLTDFELAETAYNTPHRDEHGNVVSKSVAGTRVYMAPEVFEMEFGLTEHYGKPCDMWSLGVTLYALLVGERPFQHGKHEGCKDRRCVKCKRSLYYSIISYDYENNRRWRMLSGGAKDLIWKLLTVDPKKRYTAEQVLQHDWIIEKCREQSETTCEVRSNKRKRVDDDDDDENGDKRRQKLN